MTCVVEVERILGGFPLPSGYDKFASLMCDWGYQPFPIAVLIAWLRDTSSRKSNPALARIADRTEKLASSAGATFTEKMVLRDVLKLKELPLAPHSIPSDWIKICALANSNGWSQEIVLSLLSAFHAGQVTPLNATTFVAKLSTVTPARR